MLKGLRDFLTRGNVVELPTAVIIGAAFNSVVDGLIKGIIDPLIAVFSPGEVKDLQNALVLGPFHVGLVLSALVNFVLKAAVVYFLIVRPFASVAARLGELGRLTQLVELRLYNNRLEALPPSSGNLKRLRELHLMNNRLKALPSSIGKLKTLGKLVLENNQIESLPESIGDMENLTDLDLRFNSLPRLPEALGRLKHLRFLDLRANRLEVLPESLASLRKLEKLDLRWNQFQTLPAWITKLERRGCIIYS